MNIPAIAIHGAHAHPARITADDERAFVVLVERYQPLVYRWAVALTGDGDVAEDVTQETFVRVHRKLATFRGDGPFEGWLYRIVRRVAPRTARAATHHALPTENNVYLTDPGARVDRQRAVETVRTIATTLPLRQREVFILCDLEGRSPAEVAAILGMKDVSVRASLFKARASIRREILVTHPAFREHLP